MAPRVRRARGRVRDSQHRPALRSATSTSVRRSPAIAVSFLSPIFLTLGLAAAVPLLLHLLRRRVGNRMDFPAVRYLLRAEQENRPTMRLRNLLLMLLRVAIVLMLSIAAARPIGKMIGAGHAPAAIA